MKTITVDKQVYTYIRQKALPFETINGVIRRLFDMPRRPIPRGRPRKNDRQKLLNQLRSKFTGTVQS